MPALIKTIYHPYLITGYFLKILPADLLQQIPRSTSTIRIKIIFSEKKHKQKKQCQKIAKD
jgi:SRSO17 transposase